MKKFSILLVLFVTLNGSLLISTVESRQSCPNLLFRLTPCIGEVFGFVGLKRPIGYYCCNTIVGVSNYCPKLLWPWWLVESEKSCVANRAIPPPSPPTNKGGDRAPPPPYRNNENCPDISRLYGSTTTPPSPTLPSNKGGDIATPPPSPPTLPPKVSETQPPPPSPPILPPKGSETPPPPYRNNESCPDISRLYVPCHEEIDGYYYHKIPISSSCCSLIIEVHDKCSPRNWSDTANQCYDFCINRH
ncbi:hypothetical protein TIFTF001_036864 [Ficus carica]|uniref:Prolamin-like domain-containing protein n=1 Tax=Ficus carica TaxID=3494 RepID=A0AA88JD66_FICCA|nr:hypothetical protein TIFTF001_036864 [Ficus carica]